MNEKFNKNKKVEKFTNMLGIAIRLIVIDPLTKSKNTSKTRQKFDFGMDPKITTLLPTCF